MDLENGTGCRKTLSGKIEGDCKTLFSFMSHKQSWANLYLKLESRNEMPTEK